MACTSLTNDEAPLKPRGFALSPRGAPVALAENRGEIDSAALTARRIAERAAQGRRAEPARIGLLWSSPEGRALLSAPGALALGAPPAICPARTAAAGGPDPGGAVAAALSACFDDLAAAGAPAECGCVAAVVRGPEGGALLLPEEALAYAPGVSGWVKAPALGLDLHLPSREAPGPGGARLLQFDGGTGLRIFAELRPDGVARAELHRRGAAPILLSGRHRPEGLRRGRFADRLRLTDPEGREMLLLSGYEPVEYALRRKDLLNW